MSKTYYVCKYTPVELLRALGGDCEILNEMPEGFDRAEQVAHPNICGFGKSVLEEVLAGNIKELVLVNCCDTIRSVYDILKDSGQMDFLYMIDMGHIKKNLLIRRFFLKHFSRKREYKSLILLFWAHVWDRNYFK